MDAYEFGRAVGTLLIFVVGVALLVLGSRRTTASLEPGAEMDSPLKPARRRSRLMMVAGAVLILMSMLGQFGQQAQERQAQRNRTIALPPSVLGLDRNDEATAQAQKQATGGIRTTVYGMPPKAVVATVVEESSSDLQGVLEEAARGAKESGVVLDQSADVEPGALGGKARCWKATFRGSAAILCVFVDTGSILSTIDFIETKTLQDAAQRGRTVREATIS